VSPAIRVDNLSKLYRVGARQQGYKTLRESLVDAASAPWRRIRRAFAARSLPQAESRLQGEDFWALKDVSFDVQPGEVVGIIGSNGAGKSTLLKVLSRITEPTSGRVELRGRVGSLLEVGTGFHPELTGRENVYMNGSILGMSHREITKRFDDIVSFAETEDFLDTPVKRYSSGMYVRLAFAVAAHFEPEILIVDEVLAVGDSSFQRKCLDRLRQLARSGKTVLLVSHNLQVLPSLCTKAILLDAGRIKRVAAAKDVINYYITNHLEDAGEDLTTKRRSGNGQAQFTRIQLLNQSGQVVHTHVADEDLIIRMDIRASNTIRNVAIAVVLSTLEGFRLMTSWTKEVEFHVDLHDGTRTIECRFHKVRLRPGHQFAVTLWMATHEVLDCVQNAQIASVIASDTNRHFSPNADQGIILCDHTWSFLSPQRLNG
jgi:lipopolysaccharide transport system ATP-binding protein